jgi:hypothetical protein
MVGRLAPYRHNTTLARYKARPTECESHNFAAREERGLIRLDGATVDLRECRIKLVRWRP